MGEALGTSAALCIVCSSPYYEGGYPLRPSAYRVPPYALRRSSVRTKVDKLSAPMVAVRSVGPPRGPPGSATDRVGRVKAASQTARRRGATPGVPRPEYALAPWYASISSTRPTFVFPVIQSSLSACVLSSSQVPAVTLGHGMDTCLLVHVHTRSSTNLVRSPPRSCMSGGRASPSDVFILVLGVGTLKLHPWWLRGDTEATATIPCH